MSGTVPVFVAVAARWQAPVVAALGAPRSGTAVARSCGDLADLLASAVTGQARCAVLSADLPGLDREVLLRLAASGVATVAVVDSGDEGAQRWLRQLGVHSVLPVDGSAAQLPTAVRQAVLALGDQPLGYSDPATSLRALFAPALDVAGEVGSGQMVAVWGANGAPGRTTVALTLAAELARLGWPTLLADADVYGGTVSAALGLPDEASALATACRMANTGRLDLAALADCAVPVGEGALRVLTGLDRADRWAELRPGSLQVVLELARSLAAVTVVDCAFCLEQDEELSYDTLAPRRNGATLAVLEQADLVLAVGSADPVGLHRLVRGLRDLQEAVPSARVVVVVNKLRLGLHPGEPEAQVRGVLSRHAGVQPLAVVPWDQAALDAAFLAGRPLGEVAPESVARLALQGLAGSLVGPRPPVRRRRLLRR